MAKDRWWEWIELEGDRKELRCSGCDNALFLISWERMARQATTRSAHRKRVVAICKTCEKKLRLTKGTPN
jgi:RNase P subunit RPR2